EASIANILGPGQAVIGEANKLQALPLQEVAHQYRYLRDVQSRHGTAAFLMEALGTAAGGAAGGFAGSQVGAPVQGATLGAELATGVLGRLTYTDSWDRTANQSYRDPRTGLP